MFASRPSEADVVVLGGGPAGLAAAIAARLRGFQVALIDSARPPIDKACGEGVLPEGIAALRQLGVNLTYADGAVCRGIRFLSAGTQIEGDFSNEPGRALRRIVLHGLLVRRAEEVGISLCWGTQAVGLNDDSVLLRDGAIRCRWIIGADGQNSHCRHWAGLNAVRNERIRFGYRRHYRAVPSEYVEVYWGAYAQVFVTPTGPDETGVVVLSRDPNLRLNQAVATFPELSARFERAEAVTSERGGITASRTLKAVRRGNVALIGDASGSVDAITGEGLSLSFQQAIALADSLEAGDLSKYEAAHRKLATASRMMARLLLLMSDKPSIRERILRAFEVEPRLFARLLGIHSGAVRPSALRTGEFFAFARRFLFA